MQRPTVSENNSTTGREMTSRCRASLLGLLALLLLVAPRHQAGSAAAPEVRGGESDNRSQDSRPSAQLKEVTGHVSSRRTNNTEKLASVLGLKPRVEASPICAYRVVESGIWGPLCFRRALLGYRCTKEDCRTQVTLGNLVANLLLNGSVLLQWTHQGGNETTKGLAEQPRASEAGTSPPPPVFGERRHQRAGFELSCWWNGSYTQFECAGVQLASGCRDFMLPELHENIPYRICLRPLARSGPDRKAEQRDCVEFMLPPSGMQDIVIAMTAVGGAICVMLVIICLLVAYITENIMTPITQQSYSYRTHSRH